MIQSPSDRTKYFRRRLFLVGGIAAVIAVVFVVGFALPGLGIY